MRSGRCFPERALADADQADARRARGDLAPLLGVPVAIKDEIDIAGEVAHRGSGAITTRAAADAEVVRRLRDAGAVRRREDDHARARTVAVAQESITWGVTRNPWDLERTPRRLQRRLGGRCRRRLRGWSRSVSTAPAGFGIPAACCGVFGLKPQSGRVPRWPHDRDGSHWQCLGPLTRSVLDSAIVLDGLDPGPRGRSRTREARSSEPRGSGHRACASRCAMHSPPGPAGCCRPTFRRRYETLPTCCARAGTAWSSVTSISTFATTP